ncbi:threonine--tRNA ligase [Hepatocystis sp. ex Piliocolobus tephrosceles]|nr:threonine--tRNA ligase [Hepatocystis sp. ex Piliocolobus tephrosceles]
MNKLIMYLHFFFMNIYVSHSLFIEKNIVKNKNIIRLGNKKHKYNNIPFYYFSRYIPQQYHFFCSPTAIYNKNNSCLSSYNININKKLPNCKFIHTEESYIKKKRSITCHSFNKRTFTSCNKNMNNVLSQFVVKENPSFIQERLSKFNELKEKKKKELELIINENERKSESEIYIELPDGSKHIGKRHVTTPFQICLSIPKLLSEDPVVCKVTYVEKGLKIDLCNIEDLENNNNNSEPIDDIPDGMNEIANDNTTCCKNNLTSMLWDLNLPLIGSCKIEFLNLTNYEEAQSVFWHSSAHILGSALEKLYGGYLTIGPALKEGFYYDIFLNDYNISTDDYKKIEEEFNKLVKKKAEFEKIVCTKEEVLELFKYNPFKLELIKSKIPNNKKTSVYKCGDFIDLCLGPHIKNTGNVKAFKILKNSACYWLGNKNNASLQRIYGISFLKKDELNKYIKMLEEKKKRDHRLVGKNLNFFFFENDTSPGSSFWLPHGTKIYNKLIDFVKKEYRIREYEEVITPNVFSCDLWKTSGHYDNYKDCMFIFNVEKKEWGMKPMNCPGHCIMFKQLNVSYKSLPIRLADFGVLHRNEISGSLSGLTRVRRFQQDDSHIFCSLDHIKTEVLNTLNFIFYIYELFNFKYELFLSTRPAKFIGKIETWDFAEQELKNALNDANISWKLNEGDGAFYGPKIDIVVRDCINRSHQCGTIQLDFQLPIRFNLQYKKRDYGIAQNGITDTDKNELQKNELKKREENDNIETSNVINKANESTDDGTLKHGYDRPIIIHRAILGSVERFVAILIEHTAGKLPFWLSPRQAVVLPISDKFNDYAKYIHKTLKNNLFDVEVDTSVNTLNKKIREGQLKQFNFILVVGEKELKTNTVTVRNRDNPDKQEVYTIDQLVCKFKEMLEVNSAKFNQIKPFKSVE